MADSKSAGRWAVWVRVPLRVQGVPRPGLGGTASLPPVAFWWRESGLGFKCGERACLGGCCQVPQGSSVLWGRAARVVSCVWLVSPFCGGCAFRGVAGVII